MCYALQKVEEYKYLGIILDSKLKWVGHINTLVSNLRKFFFFFKDIKRYFNIKMKRVIYISLVQSFFSYGIMFWGCAYNIHLEKLKVTINGIIKFLLGKPRYYSTKLLYDEFNVQHFNSLFKSNVLLLLYKHKDLLTMVSHSYNTRYKANINIVSNSYTTFGSQCTLIVGTNLCIHFNINLFNFKSLKDFKFFLYNLDFGTV